MVHTAMPGWIYHEFMNYLFDWNRINRNIEMIYEFTRKNTSHPFKMKVPSKKFHVLNAYDNKSSKIKWSLTKNLQINDFINWISYKTFRWMWYCFIISSTKWICSINKTMRNMIFTDNLSEKCKRNIQITYVQSWIISKCYRIHLFYNALNFVLNSLLSSVYFLSERFFFNSNEGRSSLKYIQIF